MDLTKRIDLHYGQSPIRGDTPDMERNLQGEHQFCAVYCENDLPTIENNRANDHMLRLFGVGSQFARTNDSFVRPVLVSTKTGLASVGVIDADARTLEGSGFRVGGTFFNRDIAQPVLEEFERLGYAINKVYE